MTTTVTVHDKVTTDPPKATRRRAMFFERIGDSKTDIPFGRLLFLNKQIGGEDYFTTGKLVSKIQTAEGFKYMFEDDKDDIPAEPQEFEYWLLPCIK